MKRVLALLAVALSLSAAAVSEGPTSSPGSEPEAFVNGRWFTGKDFELRTFYAVNGFLTLRKPTGSVRTIDLEGRYVVPPFADAHNHSPSSQHDFAEANRAFLEAGVFYVLNAGGNAESANPIRDRLGTPSTVDAIFAHAVFTCHGGHPKPYLEYLIDRGDLPYSKEQLEGRFFNSVDSVADVERVWPRYLATRTDFVKLIFVFSEFYSAGKGTSLANHAPCLTSLAMQDARQMQLLFPTFCGRQTVHQQLSYPVPVETRPREGFLRQQVPDRNLVESTCLYCRRIIAATDNPDLLAFIENVHCCVEMRNSPGFLDRPRPRSRR